MAETPAPDPQAILEKLEMELALKRQQRSSKGKSRTMVRFASLMLVVVILGVALFVLHHLAQVAQEKVNSPALPAIILPSSSPLSAP